MRRQTLFMVPALLAAFAMSLVLGVRTLGTPPKGPWRRVAVQGLTLDVPPGTAAPVLNNGKPWAYADFSSPVLGNLRVGRELPMGDLDGALRNWFELPGPLTGPVTYRRRGYPAQARPVIVFGPGGYALHRQGRLLSAVCAFDLEGARYWIQMTAPSATPAALATFDRVLLSLRGPGEVQVDPLLQGGLAAAEAGLAPGLAPGLERNPAWVLFLPGGMMLFGLGLALAIGQHSGRAPRDGAGAFCRYAASGVEVCLGGTFQRKYFDAALEVFPDRLTIYTFGTPFLEVPVAALVGRVKEGTAWFGPPYLEVDLEGPLQYRKNRFLYGMVSGGARLRIYTEDGQRLRMALGA